MNNSMLITLGDRTKFYQMKGLRKGQSLMNALSDIDHELYKKLTNTDADCFYDDAIIPLFWKAVEEAVK